MIAKSLGFIGGGRVTRIILEAFKKNSLLFKEIVVSDINPDNLNLLKENFLIIKTASNNNYLSASGDIVFLALHPPVVLPALDDIKPSLESDSIIISLAPRITILKISEHD